MNDVEQQRVADLTNLQQRFERRAAANAANAAPQNPPGTEPAVNLSAFWKHQPATWFATAESKFRKANITRESTKYDCIVSHLDDDACSRVEDILLKPPAADPYTTLKNALIERYPAGEDQRRRQLLSQEELGDRKPSQYLRYLRSIAPPDLSPCARCGCSASPPTSEAR